MKTIINEIDMFKATVKPDGKIDITLSGGKQFTGQMTPSEVEQLLYRVSQVSEKTISFDPEPQDLINVHDDDTKVLSAQAETIANLRDELTKSNEEYTKLTDKYTGLSKQFETNEKEFDLLRKELQKTRIELSEVNEKLSVMVETRVEETVNNIPTTEHMSTEQ